MTLKVPATNCHRTNGPHDRLLRLCASVALFALLGACASTPAPVPADSDEPAPIEPQNPAAPESEEDVRREAVAALVSGDFQRALRLYVQVSNSSPDDTEALYNIGALHERLGNRELAARAYARVVAIDPDHTLGLQGLGLAYLATDDTEQAKIYLDRAVFLEPTLWRSSHALGVIADRQEMHYSAIEHYTAALDVNPDNVAIVNNRGYSRYLLGQYEDAEADLVNALRMDPDHMKAKRNLALVYARQGRYEAARTLMTNVAEPYVVANDVGYLAMLSQDYGAAERLFRDALRMSPRHYEKASANLAELNRRRTQLVAVTE